MYRDRIKRYLRRMGLDQKYSARHIEAWLRQKYSTLDHLSSGVLEAEMLDAMFKIDRAGDKDLSDKLADSLGLKKD